MVQDCSGTGNETSTLCLCRGSVLVQYLGFAEGDGNGSAQHGHITVPPAVPEQSGTVDGGDTTSDYLVDGEVEWLIGLPEFMQDEGDVAPVGFGGWFNFSDDLIAHRNERIRAFWTPERRATKSVLTKLVHRNGELEVNVKRSASLAIANATAEVHEIRVAAAHKAWATRRRYKSEK